MWKGSVLSSNSIVEYEDKHYHTVTNMKNASDKYPSKYVYSRFSWKGFLFFIKSEMYKK